MQMKILAEKKLEKFSKISEKLEKATEMYVESHNKQHNKRAKRVETRNFQDGGHYLIRLMRTKIQQTTIISSRSCHNPNADQIPAEALTMSITMPKKCEKFSKSERNFPGP